MTRIVNKNLEMPSEVPRLEKLSGYVHGRQLMMRNTSSLSALNSRIFVTSGLACSQVQEFMWQEDVVSVAESINECLKKVHVSAAGPSLHGQASISPMWLEEM